jgi:hypothetical protein
MNTKHTPAPWTVNTTDYTNGIGIECVVNGIGHTVCTDQFCYPDFQQHGSEEKLANAKLIAAAPELLEALESLVKAIDFSVLGYKMPESMLKAKEAIKKATT